MRDRAGWEHGPPWARRLFREGGQSWAQGRPWERGRPWEHGPPWARGPLAGRPDWRAFRDMPARRSRWRSPRGDGPLRRQPDSRLVGGVAAGIARRTGFDPAMVRAVFVLTAIGGGFGAAAYVLAWLFLPAAGESSNIATRALSDKRGMGLAAGVGSLLIVVFMILSAVNAGWLTGVAWPMVICASGLALVWRNASADERQTLNRLAEPFLGMTGQTRRSRAVLRVLGGGMLLAGGLVALTSATSPGAAHELAGAVTVMVAVAIMLGPWWLRIVRDVVDERQARVRAEERAEVAARIHDSVLQTLALIQRRADNPQQVIQLARAQERELRSWLFGGPPAGTTDGQVPTVAAGVRLIQQDVEAQHGVPVEAVTVGDCEMTEDLGALLAAAREATVNAAKWSGADVISVFAEVEPVGVSLFVRDRGRGFDPQAVPSDRKGLAESIHARMARRGGTATVRSAPGEGTEVSLSMPRPSGQRQPSRA